MLQEEFKKLDLSTVANGAAPELFNQALEEVLRNISDESRDPTETRKISLTFEIKSNKERSHAVIAVQSATKLAPVEAAASTFYMRNEKGRVVAYGHNVHQPSLFPENVAPISGGQDRASRNHE